MKHTLTFPGGVHPNYNKEYTADLNVEVMPLQETYIVPVQQHIGAPASPVVDKKDEVKKGQLLAEAGGFVSAPVHAPTSGEVKKVDEYLHPNGTKVTAIEIKADGKDSWASGIGPLRDYDHLNADELKKIIWDAGIVGLGGAAFPTHVKLSPPKEKPIDTLILNGAECEPYLTADHRLMVEHGAEVMEGTRLLAKVLGVKRILVGIEENKMDAVENLRQFTDTPDDIVPLHVVYPQGSEKQLIYGLTGRSVPNGGLPMDVGIVVQNVGTAKAVYDAVAHGIPLIERIVTVTGRGITQPQNLMVRLGTDVSTIVEHCGGLKPRTLKAVMGGPMMGIGLFNLEVPVIKGTSGLLFLTIEEATLFTSEPCIRCSSCVQACPMGLLPTTISAFSVNEMFDSAESYNAMDCIECGCCAFSCPSHIPLVQNIRRAKAEINAARKKAS
jgi:electron transport complex protein RnfC